MNFPGGRREGGRGGRGRTRESEREGERAREKGREKARKKETNVTAREGREVRECVSQRELSRRAKPQPFEFKSFNHTYLKFSNSLQHTN